MAYNSTPTRNPGDLWTASDHNQYIRDNFAAGVPDIFAAQGDLAVGLDGKAAVALSVGAPVSILASDPLSVTGMMWDTRDIVLVRRTTSYTFASPNGYLLPFENLIYDSASHWSIANPKNINILTDGIYLFTVTMSLSNIPTSDLRCSVVVDGIAVCTVVRYSYPFNRNLNLAYSGYFTAGNILSVEIMPLTYGTTVVVDANNPCGLALIRLI